jgi:hypothetical protein
MLSAFPMILIAVAIDNLLVFGGMAAGQHDVAGLLAQKFSIPLYSGDQWSISISDIFLLLTLVLLFFETIKALRSATRGTVNHVLAIATFLGASAEFVTLKGFGTSTFFLIAVMALFDVVAGYAFAHMAQPGSPPPPHQQEEDDY